MIALIGPAYPWRWWIAHHTNNLINALMDTWVNVKIYTFSRQYPKFLYPGKSQKEPIGSVNPLRVPSFPTLNPINPFTWLVTARDIIHEKPTHCLIQYWHPFFAPCFTVISWLLKIKGIKTICIVQTLIPHDRHYADSWLIRFFFSQISGAVLDKSMYEQFKILFPRLPFKLIPLPVFSQFGEPVSVIVARKYLSLPQDKNILLFFGFIRKYKGLDILLRALPEIIKENPKIHLLVVGECFWDYEKYENIILENKITEQVTSHIKYVPNEEVRYWFGACDLLVMPYRHIINSGVENIWKIYAQKSLITLGSTPKDLAKKIIKAMASKPQHIEKFWWQEYVKNLQIFLKSV